MKNNNLHAIISDLHIGNKKNSPIFHKIALDYAGWLASQLKKRHIRHIIIAGDFFHNRDTITLPTLHIGHEFLDILKNFEVTITTGNHCCYYLDNSEIHSLSIFKNRKNVTIVDKLMIDGDFTYCPWGTTVEQLPEHSKVVVGHWDVQSFEMTKGKISTIGIKAADVMKKCDNCFTGHYHKPQERLYQNKPFRFLGSPYQLNWGEYENEPFLLIYNDQNNEIEKIPNTVSPRFLYINENDELKNIQNNFVSITSNNEEFLTRIEANHPLSIRVQLPDLSKSEMKEIVKDELENFQNVEILDSIDEFVGIMENYTEQEQKAISEETKKLYNQFS